MAFLALAISLVAAALSRLSRISMGRPDSSNHYARYAYVTLVLHSLVVRRVSLLVFLPCFAATYV